jgi:hypothetical protein
MTTPLDLRPATDEELIDQATAIRDELEECEMARYVVLLAELRQIHRELERRRDLFLENLKASNEGERPPA